MRRDRANDARGYLILQIKDVIKRAFETVGPQMCTGRRVDKLTRDTHAVRCFAQAAYKHITDAQLASDLLHVHRPTLVREAGVARDDEQRLEMR